MSLGLRRYRGIRPSEQRGIALALFAAGTMAIVAVAGLALDLGMGYLNKTRLQNALDAAALSGAKTLMLTGSASLATTAALTTFNLNNVTMNGAPAPTVETSPTLTPFSSGGLNPRFLRVSVPALPVSAYFARVLPEVGDTFNVGGTAVAGPQPLGEICRSLPVALCGTPGDSDCSDGSCFGITGSPLTGELEIKGDNSSLGPGNYGLVRLGCSGAACVREGMAGGRDFCFTPGGEVTTEPGVASGPTAQGLNTRFGVYQGGGVSSSEYPPDVVTTNLPAPLVTLNYAAYLALLAQPGSWNFPEGVGVPQRRVAPIPIVDCSTPINGLTDVAVIGSACLFLTRQVEGGGPNGGTIYAQLVGTCLTTGGVSETPPADASAFQIVLYQNPGGA